MANAERDYIVEKIKEVIAAPCCCPVFQPVRQTGKMRLLPVRTKPIHRSARMSQKI